MNVLIVGGRRVGLNFVLQDIQRVAVTTVAYQLDDDSNHEATGVADGVQVH